MIDYEPLWNTLKRQGKKKTDLLNLMSSRTLAKMSKNENTTTDVLDKICSYLGCKLEDVARFVDSKQSDPQRDTGEKESSKSE